jgi:excisionase family DNA binding protein
MRSNPLLFDPPNSVGCITSLARAFRTDSTQSSLVSPLPLQFIHHSCERLSEGKPTATMCEKRRCPMARTPHDPGLAEIRFLTVAEVAALMRVSRMTVYRLVHSEELPAVRVGRSFRVSESAVHDYLRRAFNDVG